MEREFLISLSLDDNGKVSKLAFLDPSESYRVSRSLREELKFYTLIGINSHPISLSLCCRDIKHMLKFYNNFFKHSIGGKNVQLYRNDMQHHKSCSDLQNKQ